MSADAANMFMALGIDNSWSYEKFLKGFQLRINKMDKENATLEFDIIGIDASIANALRRILISEVPTMAIEHVFFVNNTSIIAVSILPHLASLSSVSRMLLKQTWRVCFNYPPPPFLDVLYGPTPPRVVWFQLL